MVFFAPCPAALFGHTCPHKGTTGVTSTLCVSLGMLSHPSAGTGGGPGSSWTDQACSPACTNVLGVTLSEFQRFRCDRDSQYSRQLQGMEGSVGSLTDRLRRRAVYGTPGTPRPYVLLEEVRTAFRSAVTEHGNERAAVGPHSLGLGDGVDQGGCQTP
jgi:hypothetical protein